MAAELARWCALLFVGIGVGRVAPEGLTRFMALVGAALLARISVSFLYTDIQYVRARRGAGKGLRAEPLVAMLWVAAYVLLLYPGRFDGPFPLGMSGTAAPLLLFMFVAAAAQLAAERLADLPSSDNEEDEEQRPGERAARRDPYLLSTKVVALEALAWLVGGLAFCLTWRSIPSALWGLCAGSFLALVFGLLALWSSGGLRRIVPQTHGIEHPPHSLLMVSMGAAMLIDAVLAAHLLPAQDVPVYGRLFVAGKFMLLPGVAMSAIVMQTMSDPTAHLAERRRSFSLSLTFLVLILAGGVSLALVKPEFVVEVLFGADPGNAAKHLGFAMLAQALGIICVMLMRMNTWSKGRQGSIIGPFLALLLAAGYVAWHRRIADFLAIQITLYTVVTLLMLIWTARMLGSGVTRAYDLESSVQAQEAPRRDSV
ncbi:MAG: hypothetical protein P9M14_10595 [Candidatus Alcyoniella australis]|nr:hypothetical protein [Candidatus Alcyoniella australis]